jgi:hypothetical protein
MTMKIDTLTNILLKTEEKKIEIDLKFKKISRRNSRNIEREREKEKEKKVKEFISVGSSSLNENDGQGVLNSFLFKHSISLDVVVMTSTTSYNDLNLNMNLNLKVSLAFKNSASTYAARTNDLSPPYSSPITLRKNLSNPDLNLNPKIPLKNDLLDLRRSESSLVPATPQPPSYVLSATALSQLRQAGDIYLFIYVYI